MLESYYRKDLGNNPLKFNISIRSLRVTKRNSKRYKVEKIKWEYKEGQTAQYKQGNTHSNQVDDETGWCLPSPS